MLKTKHRCANTRFEALLTRYVGPQALRKFKVTELIDQHINGHHKDDDTLWI